MKKIALGSALFAVLAMGAIPALAQQEEPVVVTDAAGDANGLNPQQNAGVNPNGPDTRPASIDGADIRQVTARTTYTVSKIPNADGTVARVRYFPDALQIEATMEGNVKPTFGPGLFVRVPTRVMTPAGVLCNTWFAGWWRGPNSTADDRERADFQRPTANGASCPANTVTNGFTISVTGKTVTMTYPLTALTGFIENGTRIEAPDVFINNPNFIYVRAQAFAPAVPGVLGSSGLTAGQIDEAAIFPGFTVGSDVPEDVDCTLTPENPDCTF